MTRINDHALSRVLTTLLFVAFLVLYGATAAPGVDWADAAEAQFAAWNAGLSHPTGYPLYLMLGWAWSHLLAPFDVPPSRAMTLLSVVLGAAASALMLPTTQALLQRWNVGTLRCAQGRLLERWNPSLRSGQAVGTLERWNPSLRLGQAVGTSERLVLGLLAALAFGLSPAHWAMAQQAEVYALNSLLLILVLLALWRGRHPLLFALLLGVMLSHHRVSWLWLPALALWWWQERRQNTRDAPFGWRRVASFAALVALPQLAYLYIPWRGPQTPYLHQALTATEQLMLYDGSLGAFLAHVSGSRFAGDVLAAPLGEQLSVLWQSAWQNMGLALPLAALGLLPLAGLRRADRLLLLGGAALTLLFGLAVAFGDFETMIIPAWIALWLLAAVGVGALVSRVKGNANWALLLLLAALLLAERVVQRPPSRANLTQPRALIEQVLSAEPPANAILLSNDRDEMMPLWYAQWVEGRRQDMLIAFPLLLPDLETIDDTVAWAQQWERPVLLGKPMPGLGVRWEIEPHAGPLWRVSGPAMPPSDPVLQHALADSLQVTGWRVSAPRLSADQPLTVEVALVARAPLPENLAFSLQLFDEAGMRVAHEDIGSDPIFPPSQWPLDEPLRLRFGLTLPDPLPEGLYEWRVSSYVNSMGRIQPFGQQITIGRSLARPQPARPTHPTPPVAQFGEAILLQEALLPTEPPTDELRLTLRWGALVAPRRPYTRFLHVVDESGTIVAQQDAPPTPPTDTWLPGDLWEEMITLALPPELPTGRYRVLLGLYHEAGRLPLPGGADALTLMEFDR